MLRELFSREFDRSRLIMPFPMKIQPIDSHARPMEAATRFEPVKPVVKSRLKRLFERQLTSVLRPSSPASAEKVGGVEELHFNKDGFAALAGEFEPSSVCLGKMVRNFIEESNEKQSTAARCSRNRCNCFNGNCDDSSDEELEPFGGFGDSNPASSGEACELLKVKIYYVMIFRKK